MKMLKNIQRTKITYSFKQAKKYVILLIKLR